MWVDESVAVDFSAHYRIGPTAVAWYLLGYATEWTEEEWIYCGEGDEDDPANYLYNEPEEIDDRGRVRAIMVGDDRVEIVDVDDLELIGEEDFCRGCGQIGCGCEVWS